MNKSRPLRSLPLLRGQNKVEAISVHYWFQYHVFHHTPRSTLVLQCCSIFMHIYRITFFNQLFCSIHKCSQFRSCSCSVVGDLVQPDHIHTLFIHLGHQLQSTTRIIYSHLFSSCHQGTSVSHKHRDAYQVFHSTRYYVYFAHCFTLRHMRDRYAAASNTRYLHITHFAN